MDNNNLLMIVLAFVVGYCLQSMMKNMCGGRLFEGIVVPQPKKGTRRMYFPGTQFLVNEAVKGENWIQKEIDSVY
jgi:hypothetical protein